MNNCDWREENSYAYTEGHTRELWAWEFLRRNEDYLEDWDDALEALIVNGPRPSELLRSLDDFMSGKTKTFCQFPGFDRPFYRDTLTDHDRREILTLYSMLSPVHNRIPKTIICEELAAKWHIFLGELINPDVRYPDTCGHCPIFRPPGFIYDLSNIHKMQKLDTNHVLLSIDLSKSIQRQLEYFEPHLQNIQNDWLDANKVKTVKTKTKVIKWVTYLRILDAERQGASKEEIGSELFKDRDDVYPDFERSTLCRNNIKQAKTMTREYMKILLEPSQKKKR